MEKLGKNARRAAVMGGRPLVVGTACSAPNGPIWVFATLLMAAVDGAQIGLFFRAEEGRWKVGPYVADLAVSILVCYGRLAAMPFSSAWSAGAAW
jgi:hypothetical protein